MPHWSNKSSKRNAENAKLKINAKSKILSSIAESVAEVQYQYRAGVVSSIPSNEITARLCTSLEAIFVHGLKETFLGKLSSRFSSSDGGVGSPRMPEPSFWTFALVFSHKEVISQLDEMTQITSDVGRSRAWLRLALNDGLLLSYISAMISDKVSLSVHYEKFAFLRDEEKRDLSLSYLTGISVFHFGLSVNVSTLNRWQPRPLVLSGYWKETNPEVDMGADVVADIVEEPQPPAPDFVRTLSEPIQDVGGLGYMRRGLLNEDEALKLILQSSPVAFSPDTRSSLGLTSRQEAEAATEAGTEAGTEVGDVGDVEDSEETCDDHHPELRMYSSTVLDEDEMDASNSPASASPTLEWDNPVLEPLPPLSPVLAEEILEDINDEVQEEILEDINDEVQEEITGEEQLEQEGEKEKAMELEEESERLSCSPAVSDCSSGLSIGQPPVSRPNLVLLPGLEGGGGGRDLITEQTRRQQRLAGLGFSQTPSLRVTGLSLASSLSLTRCLDLICHEAGLDSQDWRCEDCSKSIGAIFGPPRLCSFTKKYYCADCHTNTDLAVIPARLLYNWDGALYKVARSSMVFLQAVAKKPIITVSSFSPSLPTLAPELDCAQRLRKQLIYLSAYLAACSRAGQEGVKVSLAEIVWPREYLYTETETYSLADLAQLHSGQLVSTLSAAVSLCTSHVTRCLICSGRGFICEICRDKKPVYPFNLDTTSQCKDCHTVFHSTCSKQLLHCPKCERMEARNLQWHVTNSKLTREIV